MQKLFSHLFLILLFMVYSCSNNIKDKTKSKEQSIQEGQRLIDSLGQESSRKKHMEDSLKMTKGTWKSKLEAIQQAGGSGAVDKIISGGVRNSNTSTKVRNEVAATLESFGKTVAPEYIQFAIETLEDLKKMRKTVSIAKLPDSLKQELTNYINYAITKISKNVKLAEKSLLKDSIH
jgi:hypothetical protein